MLLTGMVSPRAGSRLRPLPGSGGRRREGGGGGAVSVLPAGFAPRLGSFARPEAGPGGRAAGPELPGAGPGAALETIQGGSPQEGAASRGPFPGCSFRQVFVEPPLLRGL